VRDDLVCEEPSDMDIKFDNERDRILFIGSLLDNFIVHVITKKKSYQSIHSIRTVNKVFSLLIVHKERNDLYFPIDLSLKNDWINVQGDFDVNLFTMKEERGEIVCKHLYYDDRDTKIMTGYRMPGKVCRVIDAKGVPNCDHDDCSQCISRATKRGKKMCERIEHMKKKAYR
jgi:hypothetical protein